MKSIQLLLPILILLIGGLLNAQEKFEKRNHEYLPILIKPTNHETDFTKSTRKSFYQRKTEWQTIIDTTWGPGLSLNNKLQIFDTYANTLTEEFDGILSLGLDPASWDSLRLEYRSQISDSTSRGGFAAIMTYFAMALHDVHTEARDNIIAQTALNPGVPILATGGWTTVEHFGAVTTVLPDTSVLILRVVPSHPLGIQPGDIILGYDGIPYKQLLNELMSAKLPILVNGLNYFANKYSAHLNEFLLGAGMNWHLFNTIDILQYSTGNTLHLSVTPMINLNVAPMLNNEQMEIPGIPFPQYFNDELVSYGTLPNTNIGYIYLYQEWPTQVAENQFYTAVNALKNTEGLIIDMRFNLGGWALFDDAFSILFNESPLTLEDAYRCSPSIFNLCPAGNANQFQIKGNLNSIYDHPIAVLTGPNCVSMGDITSYRFSYHPMVKFFGKPTAASLGDNLYITSFNDWLLHYSVSDMFRVDQPGIYLNRREFPVDFPVWHNKDDAANGIDAVVEAALSWMGKTIYPFNVKTNSTYIRPQIDSLTITANVTNPENHNVNVAAIINTVGGTLVDSLKMFDDGNHSDSLAGDGLYGTYLIPQITEDIFTISPSVTDLDSIHYHILPNAMRFTSIGPLILEDFSITGDTLIGPGDNKKFQFTIYNSGLTATAINITSQVVCLDTFATITNLVTSSYGDISAGASISSSDHQYIRFSNNSTGGQNIKFALDIFSDSYKFWSDTFQIVITGLDEIERIIPLSHKLDQNYPNPFNPITTIEFTLPKSENVTLRVFNLLGQEVKTLVDKKLSAGNYKYNWNAEDLASGVYIYKLTTEYGFEQSKKMVLLR